MTTMNCTLHTANCTLNIANCTLQDKHCTLATAKCTLHIGHCTLQTAHCTLPTVHYKLHNEHRTLHTTILSSQLLEDLLLHFTFIQDQETHYMHEVHCTLYIFPKHYLCTSTVYKYCIHPHSVIWMHTKLDVVAPLVADTSNSTIRQNPPNPEKLP